LGKSPPAVRHVTAASLRRAYKSLSLSKVLSMSANGSGRSPITWNLHQ